MMKMGGIPSCSAGAEEERLPQRGSLISVSGDGG